MHSDVTDLCAAYWDSLPDVPRPINAPASRTTASPLKHDTLTMDSDSTPASISVTETHLEDQKQLAPIFRNRVPSSTVNKKKPVEVLPKRNGNKINPMPIKTVPKKTTAVKPIQKKAVPTSTTKASGSNTTSKVTSALKRTKREETSESHKKMKFDMEHVPQYMMDKGFSYPKAWPNAKTKWETDMHKFSAIQLSPVDKNTKLAYIEW